MIQVDLRAVALPPEARVWRLFPGQNYRFLQEFLTRGVAFLDLPGLTFPEAGIQSSPELFGRMMAAIHTKERVQADGVDVAPLTNWRDFVSSKRTKSRGRLESAIINFYSAAKQGDYIVVPSTLQNRRVYLGRISSAKIAPHAYIYGNHRVQARPIQWVADIDENKLSSELSGSLRQQHPFSLVGQSRFIEVFALANSSYSYGEHYVATIHNRLDDFLDADAALMGNIAKLAAAAVEAASESRSLERDRILHALVANVASKQFTCSQESDIHSEGFTRLISASVTPLVVSAVLAILIAVDPSQPQNMIAQELQNITVVNSLSPDDRVLYHRG